MIDKLVIGHGRGLTSARPDPLRKLEPFIPSAATKRMGEILGAEFTLKSKPLLIALTSPAMGSGKSTVADHLVTNHGFILLKFAGPLKAMTRTLLSELGEDGMTIERRVEGDLKEEPIPALQATCRQVMQKLGTEFGRHQLHENVWADVTRSRATHFLLAGKSVVIDDMRYLNELEAVRWAGGCPIRITRPGATVTSDHSSEGALNGENMLTLPNTGTIQQLQALVDQTIETLRTADSLNS